MDRAPQDPTRLGAAALAERIASGALGSEEVVEAHIARIEAQNPALNAVVWRRYDEARAEARAADRARAAGQPLGPLHGVPMSVKESLDLAGSPATFGVTGWRDHRAERDEPHLARLRAAGAIVLCKTNVAQCLAFVETDNPLHGRTHHPADPARSPGGSSGGEAALIAAFGSPLGLCTDIGGSTRVPAAFCGIAGIKPTAGRTPDRGRGSFPLGQRAIQSQVGLMAQKVRDLALALPIAAGSSDELPPLRDPGAVAIGGLRVGWFEDDGIFAPAAACRRAVREAAARLRQLGAEVVELAPPEPLRLFETFYRILSADRAVGLRRVLGSSPRAPQLAQIELAARAPAPLLFLLKAMMRLSGRRKALAVIDQFGPYTVDRFFAACEAQAEHQATWRAALDAQRLDLVLSPAVGLPAVRHGASVELGLMGSYSCLYNVLGWPAGVVPVTRVRDDEQTATVRSSDVADQTARRSEEGSAGLPIAVQLAARPFREDLVLAAMAAVAA